jgi:hypothetical protein
VGVGQGLFFGRMSNTRQNGRKIFIMDRGFIVPKVKIAIMWNIVKAKESVSKSRNVGRSINESQGGRSLSLPK